MGHFRSSPIVLCVWGVVVLGATSAGAAERFHAYVGALDETSVTLAWGITGGSGNTIGRGAPGMGAATLTVGDQSVQTSKSWARVPQLTPDTSYAYELRIDGQVRATGEIRTWPEKAQRISFFVVGDWGNGTEDQRAIARRMAQEFERRKQSGDPVRFILSTGDNLYSNWLGFSSGSKDEHWESKFFGPYEPLLSHIPMYAVLGNHDGNESESRDDLAVYLDNFFFPGGGPQRWYRFRIAGLAEFFALDSTTNQEEGDPAPVYSPGQAQSEWLEQQLKQPAPPWRIAVMHHPMFTAGPEHDPALAPLRHWFDWFRAYGVQVVLAGHEHNLQVSQRNAATGGMQFVVSGAGGQLRGANVRSKMTRNHIAAWTPQLHFCVVEIDGDQMLITPVANGPVRLVDANDRPVATPLRVPRTVEFQ